VNERDSRKGFFLINDVSEIMDLTPIFVLVRTRELNTQFHVKVKSID
jgi:hypothetical protein